MQHENITGFLIKKARELYDNATVTDLWRLTNKIKTAQVIRSFQQNNQAWNFYWNLYELFIFIIFKNKTILFIN